MRTVNIVVLLLAGALSGALLMRVAQRPAGVAAPSAPPTQTPVEQATVRPSASDAVPPREDVPAPPPALRPLTSDPASSTPPDFQYAAPVAAHPKAALQPKTQPEQMRERKPSHLRHTQAPVSVAASPRVVHTLPQRAELQKPSTIAPIQPSPPVLPEQPKETPPARMEPENVTPPSAPLNSAPEPNQATLNTGMLIPVRLLDSISSDRNHAGDVFAATLYRELVASGFVIAERGARVEGRVTAADRDAHTLSLELISVHTSDNQVVSIQTERFDKQSEPDRSQAAAKIGAGAAIGAVIGGVTAGGKGLIIGAGAGGGVGAGDVMLSRKSASLPSETRLIFRLRAPVTITERTQ